MKAALLLLAFVLGAFAQQLNIPMSPQHLFNQGIQVTYFGPPASSRINRNLLGPVQLLESTIQVDLEAGTIRLPLYHGMVGGQGNVTDQWFILTDVNNQDAANAFGINWSYKLGLVPQDAIRTATISQDQQELIWNFDSGLVDFTPELDIVMADNNEFPPSQDTQAGSIGDSDYSPLVLVGNNWIFHAPVVASGSMEQLNEFCDGIPEDRASEAYTMVHDHVLAICPRDNFVTLKMSLGFSFGKPVFYLGMGANNMILAAIENATYIPRWADSVINTGCGDNAICDIERAFAIVNGYTNDELQQVAGEGQNVTLPPLRQGLNSALLGEGDALHVFGEVPTIGLHYSPLWDIHVVEWTEQAINNGFRTRLMDIFHLLSFVRGNWLTSTGGAEVESMNVVLAAPMVHRVY